MQMASCSGLGSDHLSESQNTTDAESSKASTTPTAPTAPAGTAFTTAAATTDFAVLPAPTCKHKRRESQ